MSEIGRVSEIAETPEQKNDVTDYKNIQPEGKMTPQESRDYWNNLFSSEIQERKQSSIVDGEFLGESGNSEFPDESDSDEKNDMLEEKNVTKVDEETAEADTPEKKGGSYGEVFKEGEGDKYEVHHMPAKSASNLECNDGPAIKMEKADHRMTASCGSSKEAREYCDVQKQHIEKGKFMEALQMDIDDIREKFGDKYDDAISEMLVYVDKLESEGKIDG
jgi:hypothetical protein